MENDNNKRTSRASQTREKQSKPKVWSPPSSLDAPPAPTGFVHRWIRTYPDSDYPQVEDGKYAGVIGVGGLVLARVPEEIAKQRSEYYKKQAQDNVEAVDNDLMKEQHPSMPINIDRQTRVTFGGTKKS
jgi:hypothetical protein